MTMHVYFAQGPKFIKIGRSADVDRRLNQLRTSGPIKLIGAVVADASLEKKLHGDLQPFRVHREWFKDCHEVRAAIVETIAAFPAPAAKKKESPQNKFREVCKIIWPEGTERTLALIGGVDDRTARRWLAGETEPPALIYAAILSELTKRS